MRRSLFIVLLAPVLLAGVQARAVPPADIAGLLRERVDNGALVGVAAAWIDSNGVQFYNAGKLSSASNGAPVDENTLFEIGSISKVFTSLLLADAVKRGEVGIDDPIASFLPGTLQWNDPNVAKITLHQLAQHMSGLPRMPYNLAPKEQDNPFADYTVEQLHAYVTGVKLPTAPGEKYNYSNVGAGLLGHVLARRAEKSYEALLQERIARPLEMNSTCIVVPESMAGRFAAAHIDSDPTSHWDIPTLAGAGAIRSSAADMARFVAAYLAFKPMPLDAAIKATQEDRRDTDMPNIQVALGWHITAHEGGEYYWHNGATGGFHTFAGFDRAKRCGVVVLSNSTADIDDLGRYLLDPAAKPAPVRTCVAVPREVMEKYVGKYTLIPGVQIDIMLADDGMRAQLTGQPAYRLYPASEVQYFFRVVHAEITFEKDDTGKVTGLTLFQNGRKQQAIRQD